LWQKIPELAKAAAFEDNRFKPLDEEEMPNLSIEVTILGEPVEVKNINEIVIGRDGLIIEKGYNRGLLLPQVAVEYSWGVETFLEHTCIKAGLPPDEWKRGGAKIYKFEGIVF
jgi:AmmeMemoRadiSam system protein A